MKPDTLITKLVDQGPVAVQSIHGSTIANGKTASCGAFFVTQDKIGPIVFPGATLSIRQAAAVARAVQDAEPHQN